MVEEVAVTRTTPLGSPLTSTLLMMQVDRFAAGGGGRIGAVRAHRAPELRIHTNADFPALRNHTFVQMRGSGLRRTPQTYKCGIPALDHKAPAPGEGWSVPALAHRA